MEIYRPESNGCQIFSETVGESPLGKAIPHASGDKQLTGEAMYVDDIPTFQNEAYGVIVASTIPHGYIRSVDPKKALSFPGVIDFISHVDIGETQSQDHNPNVIGPVFHDEELFATKEVLFVGQMIGIVIAENEDIARQAAKLVVVEYEKLPAILTTEDAIEKQSFFEEIRTIKSGVFATGQIIAKVPGAEHFVEGVARMSAQEHFYLETQASLVVPGREDDEMEIYASTQNPKETQQLVSEVLQIPSNRIVVRVKRLGGGFGGKETRSAFLTCALAVAAKKLGRPIRCQLTREEDMVMTGTRHPFLGKYKVGFTSAGKLISAEIEMFANAGYSHDLSIAVLERSLTHSDNAYNIPNMNLRGRLCKTNTATNTAFRGFGGPQGMMVAEQYITHVASFLGKPVEEIRVNFSK